MQGETIQDGPGRDDTRRGGVRRYNTGETGKDGARREIRCSGAKRDEMSRGKERQGESR